MAKTLSLKECAERIGVHYMTAYRYVRLGRLPATKVAGEWRVLPGDLEALLADEARPIERGDVDWSARLEDRLLAGDETGAWTVIEAALFSGMSPTGVHVDLLAPALTRIGEAWFVGDVSIAEEHRVTALATKLIGRLGPRFVRRGRRKGRIVLGTPPGERHGLGIAVLADLLRGEGWEVIELGPDLPIQEFTIAIQKSAPVLAVGVSLSNPSVIPMAGELVRALRETAGPIPVLVGGSAVDVGVASALGADGWASDGRTAVDAFNAAVMR